MTFLNPEQKRAVETTDGRVLILAGAGSGKTRVLTHRMAYLVAKKGVSPEAILGLTFTNKAAAEMRARIAKLLSKDQAEAMTLSTFHSFCMKLLRREIGRLGFTSRFSLYDEKDMRRLVTKLAREALSREEELPSIDALVETIAFATSRGLPVNELPLTGDPILDKVTKEVYAQLKTALRIHNAVNFDQLLTLTVDLLSQFPEVLREQQATYRYIMIDEYQDTSAVQHEIAMLLAGTRRCLCVVGDDDQSIYAWRGANINQILQFPADVTITLEQNYRSTAPILTVANQVIEQNKERHQKKLRAQRDGRPVEIFHAPTEENEVEGVLARIVKLKEKHRWRWRDFAILYRSNLLSRPFELALRHTVWKNKGHFVRGIPYRVFGGIEFFERSEVKDLHAYLRVIANARDQEALLRVLNYPRRGISDKTLDTITQFNRKKKLPLFEVLQGIADGRYFDLCNDITRQGQRGIIAFLALIDEAKSRCVEQSPAAALKWLIEAINYKQALSDEFKTDAVCQQKWENVQAYAEDLDHFTAERHGQSNEDRLSEFLSATLLDSSSYKKERQGEDKLHLMTFHSAKGLEFRAVFLVGIEDHLLPHEKSCVGKGVEEERRLFYVAITRAMDYLSISMTQQRKRFGKLRASQPSRFLFDIPKELFTATRWQTC
ncbi:MAG: UvrD-helicase domain-containing protein [Chlamydiota bacterium]